MSHKNRSRRNSPKVQRSAKTSSPNQTAKPSLAAKIFASRGRASINVVLIMVLIVMASFTVFKFLSAVLDPGQRNFLVSLFVEGNPIWRILFSIFTVVLTYKTQPWKKAKIAWTNFVVFSRKVWTTIVLVALLFPVSGSFSHVFSYCYGATPSDVSNREIMILIAKFDQQSGNQAEVDKELELVLEKAKEQLKGKVNVSVKRLHRSMKDQADARATSDCYKATIIFWGVARAGGLEVNSAAVTRGPIRLRGLQTTGIVPTGSTIFAGSQESREAFLFTGADSLYVLNQVMGELYFHDAKFEEAITHLTKAIDDPSLLKPTDRRLEMRVHWVYNDRALAEVLLGRYNLALADYEQAIQLSPKESHFYSNEATLFGWSQPDRALKLLQKALDLDPENVNALIVRGNLYNDVLKDYGKALKDYDRAIELDPRGDLAYVCRGILFSRTRDFDLALADFNRAIELNPLSDDAYANRGLLRYNTYLIGRPNEALQDFNRAIELNPDNANYFNYRGALYFDILNQPEMALKDLMHAIELNPGHFEAHNNLGNVYWRSYNQFDKAKIEYDVAISLNPRFAIAYLNRGSLYQAKGELAKALADLETYISLEPEPLEGVNERVTQLKHQLGK